MKIKEEWYRKLISEYKYTVTEETKDPQHFGNAVVTLSSDNLIIRYVRDRSEVRIEIASHADPNQWFDLDIIYAYLCGKTNLVEKYPLEALNEYLLNNYRVVNALFLGDNYLKTKGSLLKLLDLRAKRIFRELDN